MRKTKYIVKPTTQFKKDYKLAMKRGLKMELLENVIAALAMDEPPPCSRNIKPHGGKFPHLNPDFCPCRVITLPVRFPAEKVLDFTGLLGP